MKPETKLPTSFNSCPVCHKYPCVCIPVLPKMKTETATEVPMDADRVKLICKYVILYKSGKWGIADDWDWVQERSKEISYVLHPNPLADLRQAVTEAKIKLADQWMYWKTTCAEIYSAEREVETACKALAEAEKP